MGAVSQISWTDATFNPWVGCQKVSPACTNCYAEVSTPVRVAGKIGLKLWGPESAGAVRRVASEAMWREPIKWNAKAEKEGVRKRVFCASLADVFEKYDGNVVNAEGEVLYWQPGVYHPFWNTEKESDGRNPAIRPLTLGDVRTRLFYLILNTPHLDWLLLTKRPENAFAMMQSAGLYAGPKVLHPQPNIWIGTTVESQEYADQRIPELLKVPAHIRFVSCEPMVGPIDLSRWLQSDLDRYCRDDRYGIPVGASRAKLGWVIAGGESQKGARPHDIYWFRSLRDQCQAAGVPFHFKQWGEWCPFSQIPDGYFENHSDDNFEALLCEVIGEHSYHRIGKKASGRTLDGRIWDEVPA